jgi:Domain of unknown function (DUF4352)
VRYVGPIIWFMTRSKGHRKMGSLAIVAIALGLSVSLAGCSSGEAEGGSSSSSSSHNEPGKNASGRNTPSVGPRGSVEVDDLRWRMLHVEQASTIGDASQGLGAQANGTFVVVTLHVTNKKQSTVTITDDVVSLRAHNKDYKVDSAAQTALSEEGTKPLVLEEVGPEISTSVRVGFDVPPAVIRENPQLRFGELGLGETHAYIALPPL